MHTLRVGFSIMFVLTWASLAMPGSAASDVPAPLYKISSITGREVKNEHGKDLGRIEEVVIDAAFGHVAYAVLAFDGFLGLGGKLFAVPWSVLQQPTAGKAFILAMREEQLNNAPGFDRDTWPDMEDRHWGDAIHAYYGQAPYWGQRLPAQVGEAPAPEPRTERLLRVSYILRSEVMSTDGQRLGDIENMVIDATSGDVVYVVLGMGGVLGLGQELFAIPWRALQQSAGFGTFTLDVDKQTLQETSGFDHDRWPRKADPRWGARASPSGQEPAGERRQ